MKDKKFAEFREKMIACAKAMDVDLEIGSITYGDNSFSFSAKGFNGEDGKREEFERYCGKKGVPANWFKQRFINDGKVYEIVAIKPRGRKNVLSILEVSTGKLYNCGKGFVTSGRIIEPTATITDKSGVLV